LSVKPRQKPHGSRTAFEEVPRNRLGNHATTRRDFVQVKVFHAIFDQKRAVPVFYLLTHRPVG
jgi:hypothetical protein